MNRDGLGDSSTFAGWHPLVTTVYYAVVISFTMFCGSPVFLAISLAAAFLHSAIIKGASSIKGSIMLIAGLTVFAALINVLFTHNGETVLFYIGGNRITLEAFVYGLVMSMVISSVIMWFSGFGQVMTSDKLIYVFGRMAPSIGLVVSMIFRFIPLLKERYSEIHAGQTALGRGSLKGLMPKIRQTLKEVSILVSWSLEASIESADSMTARGYGLRGRTSFHLFRFDSREAARLILVIGLGACASAARLLGAGVMYIYPVIRPGDEDVPFAVKLAGIASFILLALLPAAADIYGDYRWKRSA